MVIGRKPIDLTGQRFGRLTIVDRAPSKPGRAGAFWNAVCDCGGTTQARASDFKKGHVNSCGCYRREMSKSRATHGESHPRTKEYAIWCSMKQRCLDKKHKDYPKYGARGIEVSEEFMDYAKFLLAVGRCPEGCSLERKDNDGPYSTENCYWATGLVQSNNKRNNKFLSLWGETKTLAQWSRDTRCVVPYTTLKSRVGRQGWGLESALITPPQPRDWMRGKTQDHFKHRQEE